MTKIIAIKDMANGNETIGEMWKETKIFNSTDTLMDVMEWVGTRRKNVILTLPDGHKFDSELEPMPF